MLQRNNGQVADTAEGDLFLYRTESGSVGSIRKMCNARVYSFASEHWQS